VANWANFGLFEPDNNPSSRRLENDSKDECGVLEVDIEEVQGEDMET
jgi:hypothetical protein